MARKVGPAIWHMNRTDTLKDYRLVDTIGFCKSVPVVGSSRAEHFSRLHCSAGVSPQMGMYQQLTGLQPRSSEPSAVVPRREPLGVEAAQLDAMACECFLCRDITFDRL